jgi:lipoate-protein ligase A
MLFYFNESTDPYYNLALEEYIFTHVNLVDSLFMLWRNQSAVVIGRNQNAVKELNHRFAKDNNIKVVRRNTGGGTVYHDLGNLNYSFMKNCEKGQEIDFSQFAVPIIRTLNQYGVKAECNSRNDLVIDGKKFSGTAQTIKNGRMLHHGTLLFNSNLDLLRNVLKGQDDVIQSGGVKSVSSHITNISDYLALPLNIEEFRKDLMNCVIKDRNPRQLQLSEDDLREIMKIREEKYMTWEWNYGKSPRYEIDKKRQYKNENFLVSMAVSRQGLIEKITISGTFPDDGKISQLEKMLVNKPLRESVLLEVLSYCDVSDYIPEMTSCELVEILLY